MTNVLKSKIAKAGLGMLVAVGMILGGSNAAQALTQAEANAIIAALGLQGSQAAAIQALVTGGNNNTTCYTFTANATMGTTGEHVRQLQMRLNSNPATKLNVAAGANGSAGHETTYFGAATRTAVSSYQALNGISPTAGYFGPATRAHMNANCTQTPPPPQTTGPVAVSLATNNPSAGTIVSGQATADLAHFTFTGNGTVTSVTLAKTGVSANTTLANVYLYEGGARLTDAASVTTNGAITFNGLNMNVSGSRTISVRADIAASTSGQTVGVNLTGFTANGTNVAASAMGNIMSIAAATDLATAVLSTTNTVASPSVDSGTSNYTIWGNTLQIGQRTVWLKGANFRVIGSAETGALQNARLIVDGAQVGTAVASVMTNGTLSFDLSGAPVSLNTGSHTIEVRADIVGGANRNFYLSLQNAGDLMLTDSQYNVNIMLNSGTIGTTYNMSTGGNTGTVTINNGTLSLSTDNTFNTGNTVTSGASNVAIARYNVKAFGEAVKVMQMTVTINPAATGGDFLQNVGLFVNGAQVGTSQNTDTDPDTLTFNLGSSLIVPAGTTVPVEVRANMVNGTGTNFAGTLATSVAIPQYQAQGMSSYSLYPATGSLTSGTTTVTVGSVSVTFAKATAYTNQTLATNTSNQKIGSYVIQAGNTEGVRVTNVSVALSGTITTTFVDAGSSTLTGTGAGMTVNVASTSGISVGDTVVVETTTTDFTGTVTAVVDGDTLTVTGTVAGTADPVTNGAAVTVTPVSMTNVANNLSNLKIVVNGGAASTPVNPQATNNFSVDFTVPAGQTQTLDIYADLGTRTGTVVTTTTLTARGAQSNTTITDFDPNTGGDQTAIVGQTITEGTGTVGAGSVVSMTTSSAHYVVGSSTTEAIIRYNFTSSNGTSTINELWFTVGGTAGAVTSLTATGSMGGSCTAPVVGTTAYMTGCNMTVPQGFGGTNITVTPTYNTVGYTGVTAGSTATVDLTHINSTSGGTTTGQTAVTLATSNSMTLVATLPTLSLSSSSASFASSQVKVGSVTITAGAGGDIRLESLPVVFSVSGGANINGSAGDDVILKEGNVTIGTSDNLAADSTGATVVVTFDNDEIVAAGTTRTFDIYVTGEAASGDDAITVSLNSAADFVWDDITGNGNDLTGTLMLNYPTSSVSIDQ